MRRFAPGRGMTAFVALLLPVLLLLGSWQLERAATKRLLQQRFQAALGAAPVAPPQALGDDFLRVRLRGRYAAGENYLVDNRVQRGRVGYWVVSRFRGSDGRVFLVNRGWVVAPPRRELLPAVETPAGSHSLVGVVWPFAGLPPLLADDPWSAAWPKRVQRLDVARMAPPGSGVVPVEIRLEPGEPGALGPLPFAPAGFGPERHRGYAVQWFGLAVVLAAGFVVYGLRGAAAGKEERRS